MKPFPDRPIALWTQAMILGLAMSSYGDERPNIVFIFSDDHALNAISAYGGPLAGIAPTPNIDRLATEGALFRNSFCANSICGPSRATILTGKHSHANGFLTNRKPNFDQSQWTLPKALQAGGYRTAVIGKWHLGSAPVGFDHWEVLYNQGTYYNPLFRMQDGTDVEVEGYCTDIVTEKALDWLEANAKKGSEEPFFLMCQHKAPHRNFAPALRHLTAFDGVDFPEPETLFDDYGGGRSSTLATNKMEVGAHLHWGADLKLRPDERGDIELPGPDQHRLLETTRMTPEQKTAWDAHFGPRNQEFLSRYAAGSLSEKELVRWKLRRYLEGYLGTIRAVDEGVGRVLDRLDTLGLAENTIIIYASDQGFYLGEHGWFDKRWMFEESLAMPFIVRWPGVVKPGSRPDAMIQNIDYAPTFLEIAGLPAHKEAHGHSLVPILRGDQSKVRDSIYYAYYEGGGHGVPPHFGVRTSTHKLMHFPATKEWNLFDLTNDPQELLSQYDNPEYASVRKELEAEYYRLRQQFAAPAYQE